MKQRWVLLLCMGCLGMLTYRFLNMDSLNKYKPPSPKIHIRPTDFPQPTPFSNKTVDLRFKDLLRLIDWPEPPSTVRHFNFSTSPSNCDYHLLNPRDTYRSGETLEVVITARDHNGRPKEYGGDFFQAKMHSPALQAGVTGQVKDHGNGSYLATFLLPWPGNTQVHIRLIHSSEAVDVLKKKRESHPEKVYFNGYFQFNGSSEVQECNLEIAGKDVCKYRDPISGDTWQCVRPRKLPCDSWVYHSMGGYRTVTNTMENSLLSGSVTDKIILGKVSPINVMSDNSSLELTSNLSVCRPGQESPQPSGFYYGDTWTSFKCLGRHFPKPTDAIACLKGKDIHMFGDSTLRQWFEYLERFIPSLKRIDLHVNYQSGPLLAVDAETGLVMRWRAHGLPLRTTKTMTSDLHYEVGSGPSGNCISSIP